MPSVKMILVAIMAGMLLLLSACQITPPTTALSEQQKRIGQLNTWRAEGKIAFNMKGKRQSASFDWQQRNDDYDIRLFGPFGQGATRLQRTNHGVTLTNAEIGSRRAADAEQLMQDNLGWHAPVSNLQYWLRGLNAPEPTAKKVELDEQGLLKHLSQQGWQVDYSRYELHEGLLLPAKMTAQRDGISVTLVIKQWQLP